MYGSLGSRVPVHMLACHRRPAPGSERSDLDAFSQSIPGSVRMSIIFQRKVHVSVLLMIMMYGLSVARTVTEEERDSSGSFYAGIVAGYNGIRHLANFQSIDGCPACVDFGGTAGNGSYHAGLSTEYRMGHSGYWKSSIIGRIVYSDLSATFTAPGSPLAYVDSMGNVGNMETRHVADVAYSVVDIEALFKLDLFNSNFGLVIGPVAGLRIRTGRERRIDLVGAPDGTVFDVGPLPPGMQYSKDGRSLITSREGIPDQSGIRWAMKFGAQYEIQAGAIFIVPGFAMNAGLARVSQTAGEWINALQTGIDLRVAL